MAEQAEKPVFFAVRAVQGSVRRKNWSADGGTVWGHLHMESVSTPPVSDLCRFVLCGLLAWLEGLARLGEVFVKLGRLASGMPTEIKEVSGEFKATLSVEWESRGYLPKGLTEADDLVRVKENAQPIAIYSPAEMAKLLHHAG